MKAAAVGEGDEDEEGEVKEERVTATLTKDLRTFFKKKLNFKQKQWMVDAPLPADLASASVDLKKGDVLVSIFVSGEDVTLKSKIYDKKFELGNLKNDETELTFKRSPKPANNAAANFEPKSRKGKESEKK